MSASTRTRTGTSLVGSVTRLGSWTINSPCTRDAGRLQRKCELNIIQQKEGGVLVGSGQITFQSS